MKPKSTFLGISVALALLIAILLPTGPTLALRRRSGRRPSKIYHRRHVTSAGWTRAKRIQDPHPRHGGNITDYAIQMWFRDTDAGGYGVNNRGYGGDEDNGVC